MSVGFRPDKGQCEKKCPQWQFNIPKELAKIERFVESVRRAEPDFRMSGMEQDV